MTPASIGGGRRLASRVIATFGFVAFPYCIALGQWRPGEPEQDDLRRWRRLPLFWLAFLGPWLVGLDPGPPRSALTSEPGTVRVWRCRPAYAGCAKTPATFAVWDGFCTVHVPGPLVQTNVAAPTPTTALLRLTAT